MYITQVGAIPERALSSMAYQVLLALCYLKEEKRVHRDIKPSNLLINSQGVVKVCVRLLVFYHTRSSKQSPLVVTFCDRGQRGNYAVG